MLKMKDATKPVVLAITEKHVDAAKRADGNHCVVAACALDHFDHADNVIIGNSIAHIITGNRVVRYGLGASAKRAIRIFDETGHFPADTRIELRVLSPSQRKGARSQRKNSWEKSEKPAGNGKTVLQGRRLPSRDFRKFKKPEQD